MTTTKPKTRKNPEKTRRFSKDGQRHAAARLIAAGESVYRAAKSQKLDHSELGKWLKSPEGSELLRQYAEEHSEALKGAIDQARTELRLAMPEAVRAHLKVIRTAKGMPLLKAVEMIYDRAGLPKTQRIEGSGFGGKLNLSKLSEEQLEHLAALTSLASDDDDASANGDSGQSGSTGETLG